VVVLRYTILDYLVLCIFEVGKVTVYILEVDFLNSYTFVKCKRLYSLFDFLFKV